MPELVVELEQRHREAGHFLCRQEGADDRPVDGEENTATPWMRFVLSVGVAVGVVWLVNVV